jgi:mannose-1-phosphate guanylyltransferase
MITVIMAAGSGTRLWALSRTRFLNNFISRL